MFAQWLSDEETDDLGEGMKYHEDRHKCTIHLLIFHGFLDALTKGMTEEVWNDHVLNKHCKNIEGNIVEVMDMWNNLNQDLATLHRNVKLYTVRIKHHAQSTKYGVQDIAL